jgi:23S rRNA (uracil1939-C5)-methyltransferase
MSKQKRWRAAARAQATQSASAPQSSTSSIEFDVMVERIVPGGMGLAHADGRTIFVALAAQGDHVRVRVEKTRGKVVFASIIEVLAPSTVRVAPPCPYFGRCGGCDFQQLNYDAQLEAKIHIVQDCLRRIAGIETPVEVEIKASPNAWHYRSRAQWQHDRAHKTLGYFERGSHKVCDVVECPVIVPALQESLTSLREAMREGVLPEHVAEFQAVAGDGGMVSIVPPINEPKIERESARTIGGFRYRFDAEGFFQINHEQLPALIAAALSDCGGETAVDLYCGVGLFTLPLATRFKRVIGVEASDAAINYARLNLDAAQLTNAQAKCARVGDWLKHNAASLAPIDFVLLDPPRAGVEDRDALDGILALRPKRIAYVSCDPATLARDLRAFIGGGYRLDSVSAFDMFPQTHHVETIAHLSSTRER